MLSGKPTGEQNCPVKRRTVRGARHSRGRERGDGTRKRWGSEEEQVFGRAPVTTRERKRRDWRRERYAGEGERFVAQRFSKRMQVKK